MKKVCWKYFWYCIKPSLRWDSNGGWSLTIRACPVFLFHFEYKYPVFLQEHRLRTSSYFSLFPGFPDPGSIINVTWEHVFGTDTLLQEEK